MSQQSRLQTGNRSPAFERLPGEEPNLLLAPRRYYYAAECVKLAQATVNQIAKARLLQMAEAWRKLADEAGNKGKPS